MNSQNKPVTVLLFCLLFFSCVRQSPQIPSNKGVVIDNNSVSLLAINENLAKKEDSILKTVALKQDIAFKRSGIGFWYRVYHVGQGSELRIP